MRKPAAPPVLAAAALVVTLLPAGAAAAPPEAPAAPPGGGPDWGACPSGVAAPGLECATLDVPLDYRDPDGRTIEIAISRLASTDPGRRRGVLLTNSGGPGGQGLGFPAALRDLGIPERVLETYDVIGVDPRGVGHSTPVTCDLTRAEQPSNIPRFARNDADVAAEAKRVAAVAAKCGSSRTAPLLPHITTANTARDLDRVRAALGEPKASYLGISYGTYLGAVYATMFPHRTDRFLLDSAAGPGGWDVSFSRMFGRGFADRFPDFAEFAAAHHEKYRRASCT
ncbi:alpha/beta fold hydrolase [Actinomadura sp. WMMB 499]|uniref:alpha/beta fold hydrolase n=1 Tax=Actinomadura sp. WMMB 499 TaxID=1219491 RepID=UPI001C3FF1A8|nr:alpha/beta fold hydrolase [Actinomadura sp. WMMB 499]